MKLSLFISSRFIKSQKESKLISSVSFITISGIALGLIVVLLALSILDGFEKVISEKISNFNSQIKVTGFGNRNLNNPETVISNIQKKFKDEINLIEPFTYKLVIIKSKKITDGINLTGLTKKYFNHSIEKYLIEKSKNENEFNSIYVGKILSEKLKIKIDDKVTVFSLRNNKPPTIDNPPAIEQFIVKGIYETGIAVYDDGNAIIDFNLSQKLFGMENEFSGLNIEIKNSDPNNFAVNLQDFLDYPFYVRTIYQVHQNIFTWIELQKKPIPIILGLIIIVALFNIVGTLLMVVLDKTNQIGILQSMGLSKKKLISIFILNSNYFIYRGLLIGNLVALILSVLQKYFNIISLPSKVYFVTSVPVSINLINYLIVNLITILVAFLSAFIPAYISTKIKPINAVRFN
ncbi:MAG: FtsX-like permease family protein [Melioribacteraceae bacterium]|nr:FtsX-like permease family protein [Melioribacteraceae bacterium]